MKTMQGKLRQFAKILTQLAWDQGIRLVVISKRVSKETLRDHGMSKDELDALAKECGFSWRCQPEPIDPKTICKACGHGFTARSRCLCNCAEGAKTDEGARLRYKSSIRQCFQTECAARADVDGWCDEHSWQFKEYGTRHPVGSIGVQGVQGVTPRRSAVSQVVRLCEQCSPAGIEEKTKAYGFGACESCLVAAEELRGFSLREILSALTVSQDSLAAMSAIWLIRGDCGDYYCGCGGGHVYGVATTQEQADALAHAARGRLASFMTVTVEGPLRVNALHGAAFDI